MSAQTATVPKPFDGLRLDAALVLFLPEAGMRQRRRLFDTHTILVNGTPAKKGDIVSEGDVISLLPAEEQPPSKCAPSKHTGLPVLEQTEEFAAIHKPGGMHSAAIAGKPGASVEAILHSILPDASDAVMLNRLDQLTSGMVLAGLTKDAPNKFRALEDEGAVEKIYLAVVEGLLGGPMHIANQLDTDNRKTTKVLDNDNPDTLRHTAVLPLRPVECEGAVSTLVLAVIHKGARHQIRAHLAHAGHPIIGDPLYGTTIADSPLYLHHYMVTMPGFAATCPPDWKQWEDWQGAIPGSEEY